MEHKFPEEIIQKTGYFSTGYSLFRKFRKTFHSGVVNQVHVFWKVLHVSHICFPIKKAAK